MNAFANSAVGRAIFGPIARAYQNSVLKELAKMGLRAEDLIRTGELGNIGKSAVALMPEHAQQARLRRLMRAQDLANKHLTLTEQQQKLQQPLKQDLVPIIRHLQQRDLERRSYK